MCDIAREVVKGKLITMRAYLKIGISNKQPNGKSQETQNTKQTKFQIGRRREM